MVVPLNVMVAPDLTSLRSSVTPAGTVSELMVMAEQDDTSVPLVYVPDNVQLEDSASWRIMGEALPRAASTASTIVDR